MFVSVTRKIRKAQIKRKFLGLARSLDYSQHKHANRRTLTAQVSWRYMLQVHSLRLHSFTLKRDSDRSAKC